MSEGASHEQIIGDRYALYGPIASGGMATVHFGRLLAAGGFARTVAIKRIHGEFLETPEIVSTLLDEARLASRIRHPNVVATLDMVAANDEVFLIMEYVSGESLSRLLARARQLGDPIDPKIAAGILSGILYGLHAAHDATDEHGEPLGIVHRDVSPQNILVGTDGLARLLDFGIAKGKGRLQVTRAGQLKGKVGYMAPEQILGEEPDRRSDVYAAAVVLWEVLTGQRLFALGDSPRENFNLIPKILEADIEPPSAVAPGVPGVLNGIVMRGLNREPDARYATARDFAIALEEATPIATHRQIGDWVAGLAAEALEERSLLLQELESASTSASRASVDLVDTAVRARRRKRLASNGDERGYRASDAPPTTPEQPHIADDATEVESSARSGLTEDETTHEIRGVEPTAARLARTQLTGSMAAAEARKRAAEIQDKQNKQDDEAKRKTTHWNRKADGVADEPTHEPTTSVHQPSQMLKAPPTLPHDTEVDAVSSENLNHTLQSARPDLSREGPTSHTMKSNLEPHSLQTSSRPLPSSYNPSSREDDLKLPVSSNTWFFVAIAVVIAGAMIGIAYKLLA